MVETGLGGAAALAPVAYRAAGDRAGGSPTGAGHPARGEQHAGRPRIGGGPAAGRESTGSRVAVAHRAGWAATLACRPQSLHAQGLTADDAVLVSPSWLRQWPVGPALVTGSLWQDPQTGRVYLVAAGQRRWIPDLLTFSRLGLAWSQVRPATVTELQGVPAGPAVPWIVTGWASPSETAPSLPYLGAAPHRFAPEPEPEQRTVDTRFLPALELMRSFVPTSQWPDFLERAGVSLIVEEDDRSLLPQYSELNNVIAFGAGFVEGESDDSLAAALIKQTVHAISFHRYWHEISGRSCIREQAIAFGWEAIFWASRHGLDGQPGEATALADLHNLTLEWALDDRLDGALLAHFGYQVSCYFPGAFQSIDEEGSDYGTLY